MSPVEPPSPTVSVLIVNWNTRDLLHQCLTSLENAEAAGYLEVIVVDNGSSDGSAELLREGEYEAIINTDNRGFTAATNQAFERATAPYVLMLNSDTVVSPGTIRSCVEYMRSADNVAGVGCRLLNPDGTAQSSVFRFPSLKGVILTTSFLSRIVPRSAAINFDRYGGGDLNEIAEVDVVMGSFLLIDREFLVDDNLLDDGYFMFGEETDLCRRLRAAGGRILFLPHRSIVHVHGASAKTADQIAWSELAKRRGVLRFLRIWRRRGVAEIANIVMLFGLAPRYLAWCGADIVDLARGRPQANRRRRAAAVRFHLQAVKRPSAMDEPWGPPPSVTT